MVCMCMWDGCGVYVCRDVGDVCMYMYVGECVHGCVYVSCV